VFCAIDIVIVSNIQQQQSTYAICCKSVITIFIFAVFDASLCR